MLKFNPFKSLTIAGAVLGIGVGVLFPHFDPTALSDTARTVIQGVGALVSVVGIRNAVAKAAVQVLTDLATKR